MSYLKYDDIENIRNLYEMLCDDFYISEEAHEDKTYRIQAEFEARRNAATLTSALIQANALWQLTKCIRDIGIGKSMAANLDNIEVARDPKDVPDRRAVSIQQAAIMFGVSNRTVYNYVKNGVIKAVKLGGAVRISIDEIERVLGT